MPKPRTKYEGKTIRDTADLDSSKKSKKQTAQKAPKLQKLQKVKAPETAPVASANIPVELQQLILNIFKTAFVERFDEDIKPLLQEVKGHLYNRDFATAFGKKEYLETYAARWSASRALGYADLFWDLRDQIWPTSGGKRLDQGISDGSGQRRRHKMLGLGAGAGAELVALASVQHISSTASDEHPLLFDLATVDIADWTSVIDNLTKHATSPPPLSKYVSAAVQAANLPLVPADDLVGSFHQCDILNMEPSTLTDMLRDTEIITLMFTLNELYSTSISLTQKFLLNLTSALSSGALLLVVDSPGSYSTITLNGAEKEYPMKWLLDHTLLGQVGGKEVEKKAGKVVGWEKIHEDESRWFRLNQALQYPIDLENMRMQVHLYRRL
jgi:25S rRNA (uracil2843-N3)-methyltransferase